MAAVLGLCVFLTLIISTIEDICTNKWNISVDGVSPSDLTVHHMSTSEPGLFTHLVWQWQGKDLAPATMWISQRPYGKVDGGFVSKAKGLFHIPASFKWSLSNRSLRVVTHGNIRELDQYPAWTVDICSGAMMWGVSKDKELNVNFGDGNETRSLDESWSLDVNYRRRRQAEFPAQPDQSNGFASWWRRFIDTLNTKSRPDDKPQSWVWDLTELILKLIFAGARSLQPGVPPAPENPDAEMIPSA